MGKEVLPYHLQRQGHSQYGPYLGPCAGHLWPLRERAYYKQHRGGRYAAYEHYGAGGYAAAGAVGKQYVRRVKHAGRHGEQIPLKAGLRPLSLSQHQQHKPRHRYGSADEEVPRH